MDQGGTSTILNIHYEKEELEGKNCGFVCVCVCVCVLCVELMRGSLVWEESFAIRRPGFEFSNSFSNSSCKTLGEKSLHFS